jgi:CheY-like chemotaxis protein
MGGAIGVDSEPGWGSTFWFTIAVKDGAEASVPFGTFSQLRSRHVLVVGDQAITRSALVQQLRAWDVVVDEAGDGAEALDRLRAAVLSGVRRDAVLADLQRSSMDAGALAGAIASDPTLAGTPLVMVSPWSRVGIGAAPAVGIAAGLTRPIRPTRLQEALMGVLGGDNVPPAAPAEAQSAESTAAGAPRSLRILVAEDNAVNQRLAVRMLEKAGHRVDLVSNGREAVEALDREPYDLVFMDCLMPEMDGFEATRAIRAAEVGTDRHVPIVALTANAMLRDREQCLAAGMDDYLAKPFTRQALTAALELWTGLPR